MSYFRFDKFTPELSIDIQDVCAYRVGEYGEDNGDSWFMVEFFIPGLLKPITHKVYDFELDEFETRWRELVEDNV